MVKTKDKCWDDKHHRYAPLFLVALGIIWLLEPMIHESFNFTVPIMPVILIVLGLFKYYKYCM